jgi:hypothetical protein
MKMGLELYPAKKNLKPTESFPDRTEAFFLFVWGEFIAHHQILAAVYCSRVRVRVLYFISHNLYFLYIQASLPSHMLLDEYRRTHTVLYSTRGTATVSPREREQWLLVS